MRSVKSASLTLLIIFLALTCFLTYGLERDQTSQLIACYGCLFALYAWINWKETDIKFWLIGSFIIRCSLLLALPNLSDDFYRFIWDGRLWAAGQHPFSALPGDFLSQNISGIDQGIFEKLNSKDYFTIYPPLAQFIFWLSVRISSNSILGSVVAMRVLVLMAEAGSMILIVKLLERFQLPRRNVLLYALNPLIILELTGNLHFESFVILFLLLCVWLLSSNRVIPSAISFAFAVGTKLVPLIFLPIMLGVLGWRKVFVFYLIAGAGIFLLFIPMYDHQVLAGFSQSLGLYFQKFEFNASLYNLVRAYGFWKVGYDIIQTAGWKLGVVSGMLILVYSFFWGMSHGVFTAHKLNPTTYKLSWTFDHSIVTAFLFTLFIYLIFSTTVHPWYITTLLALSVLTRFRFAMVWSAFVFLTYIGYSSQGFSEKLWITAVEYTAVTAYLAYELFQRTPRSSLEHDSFGQPESVEGPHITWLKTGTPE